MHVSDASAVEQPPITLLMYHLCYVDNNNIGAEGCRRLSQAQWANLLALDLGIICLIKRRTILELKAVSIFARLSGLT